MLKSRRLRETACLAAVSLLTGTASLAQPPPERQFFAATSSPADAVDVIRANALIDDLVRDDELVRVSVRADRTLPGRLHEYFTQVHRGVPVHGAGLARQSAGGVPVSVFGTTFAGIDIDTEPSLDAEAALDRMEALAGAARATSEPAELVIVPTMLGDLVLAWRATMRDFHTYFVDAHTGEPVHRFDHVFAESEVGSGLGITGALQKVSAWSSEGRYEAWDRLRPAEIVTIDAEGDPTRLLDAFLPSPAWESAVASDDDNEWTSPGVVDGHANVGFTYDYLFNSQNWRGMDGRDGRIFSVVNLDFFNALYLSPPFGPQGGGLLAFGATDEDVPLVPLDVAAHELMHGVTYSALTERTGQWLEGAHTAIPGPSRIRVADEVIRCGDSHTFPARPPDEPVVAPYLCFDANGNPTEARSGRFALFLAHGDAINEAYSDLVGVAVEFSVHPPGDGPLRADYLAGEDAGVTIRRIDDPHSILVGGVLPYPDAMGQEFRFVVARVGERFIRYTGFGMKGDRVFRLSEDGYDGAHWNSTILSHAFYLAIEGGRHSSGRTVDGVGAANRLQVEQAFFRGLVDLAPPFATFQTMGLLIRQAALDLHGAGSAASAAIDQALTAAGI